MTVASGLSAPHGLALDSAGNLFVADTDHCRVMMLAARTEDLYGRHEQAGRFYDVAGRTCAKGSALRYPTGLAVNRGDDLFIAEATTARVVMVRPQGPRSFIDMPATTVMTNRPHGPSSMSPRASPWTPPGISSSPTPPTAGCARCPRTMWGRSGRP